MPQKRSPMDGDDTLRLQLLLKHSWEYNRDKSGIKKKFTFPNWTRCHEFAHMLAVKSWTENHHALLIISQYDATVFWTTYRPVISVSNSDISMAEVTDKSAPEFGSYDVPDQPDLVEDPGGAKVTQALPDGWLQEGARLSRTFYFKTYTKCRDFVSIVAIRCKSIGCWPTIVFFPCWVKVHWPELSAKSIKMAQVCTAEADQIGVERNPDVGADDQILRGVS